MRDMKRTGIPWLPEIAEDFSVGYVKQYFNISKDLSKEGEPERVLKLARAGIVEKDVTTNEGQMAASYVGYNKVQVGDLLLNPMDLYSGANCNVSELDGVISPAYSNLRAKRVSSVVPKFYDYYFKCQYWLMAMFAHGKGVSFDNRWTLNNDSLRTYEIPVVPYTVQQSIVERIQLEERKVDALIANVQSQIEKLKAYKQSLISEVVTKGLDPSVSMKDSGVEWIGEVPEHWNMAMFGRFIKTIQTGPFGNQLHSDDYVSEGTPIINPANIQNGRIVVDENTCVSDEKLTELNQHLCIEGDILFGRRGEMGRCAVVEEGMRVFCGTGCIKIQCKSTLLPKYAILFLQTSSVRSYLDLNAVGTTMKNLNTSIISCIPFTIPSRKEQLAIVSYITEKCDKIDQLIVIKQKKIDKLNEYKKSFIYEYVIGKKEVR